MQQSAISNPAPQLSPQEAASKAEQNLRAHLGPLLATTSSAPTTDAKPAASEGMNIDPAISGPTQQPQIPATASPHQPQPAPMGVQPVLHQVQMDVQQQHQQQQQHLQSQQQQLQGQQPAAPEGETPKKGNKRELSTSKRAAQNRAAQRAFRQRKECYIKKLEEQVREFSTIQESYNAIKNENFELRNYIISLQSRIIEIQGEDALPPPPLAFSQTPIMLDPSAMQAQLQQPGAQHQQPQQSPVTHLAVASSTPTSSVNITAQSADHVSGQKRTHDESDSAFLQSIAQAAGSAPGTNNFTPLQKSPDEIQLHQQATAAAAAAAAVSAVASKPPSPNAKRIKSEKNTVNGTTPS